MPNKTSNKPGDYRSVVRESRAHRALARQAARQAARVLPFFEKAHPKDKRPRLAIEAIRAWGQGRRQLGMVVVRKLALDAHAAARATKMDTARFAARAAGQAVAVWHVPNHALVVPYYVAKLVAARKMQSSSAVKPRKPQRQKIWKRPSPASKK